VRALRALPPNTLHTMGVGADHDRIMLRACLDGVFNITQPSGGPMMRCPPCTGGASPLPSVVPASSDLALTSVKYVTHSAPTQQPLALPAPRAEDGAAAAAAQPSSAGLGASQPPQPMITDGQVAHAPSPTPSEGVAAILPGLSSATIQALAEQLRQEEAAAAVAAAALAAGQAAPAFDQQAINVEHEMGIICAVYAMHPVWLGWVPRHDPREERGRLVRHPLR